MLSRSRALGLVPALIFFALPTPVRPRTHPVLAGGWDLNPQLSKTAGQHLRGGPSGGGPGRRPGGEPPEGVEGGFGGGFSRFGASRGLEELMRPKEQLTITQTDTLIVVTDDAGWSRELIPTGQRMREVEGQGGPAEVVTRWKGDDLITERYLDQGGTYSETYALDRKTHRLRVVVSFKSPRMPRAIEATRVYEASVSG